MLNTSLFLFIVLLLATSCLAPETVSHLENKYDRALQLDDYQTAIVYLHEIQDLDTDNNTVYKRLANCYYKLKKYPSAIKAIDIALKEANSLEQQVLLQTKVKSLTELRKYSDAVAIYDTLITLDSKGELEYRYEIGVLYKAQGDLGSSIVEMQKNLQHPLAKLVQREIILEQQTESVSYYHACLNFIGACQIQGNNLAAAQRTYNLLRKDRIPFKLAEENYQILQELLTQKDQQ